MKYPFFSDFRNLLIFSQIFKEHIFGLKPGYRGRFA